MRIFGGRLLCGVLVASAACSVAPETDPTTDPTTEAQTGAATDLPEFSVARMLDEMPVSVAEPGPFMILAADLDLASSLAGVQRPVDPAEASPGLSALTSGVEDPVVHVPLEIPLASRYPAALVEEDLQWSVLDVRRFVSWTTSSRTSTVAAGGFDEATLEGLPEAGGISSAGQGKDLQGDLATASPARPQGIPLRMAVAEGRLIASPFTRVVQQWLDGRARTLADAPVLAGLASVLDARAVYSARISTPVRIGTAPLPPGVMEALGLTEDSFPEYDLYGIGWATADDGPLITVAYHDTDGRELAETRRRVEERWTSLTGRGRRLPDLVEAGPVTIEGEYVVVELVPVNGQPPEIVALIADQEDLPFWTS